MENSWKTSIYLLEDILNQKKELQNSSEVQSHLQSLIECVQELYRERNRLRDILEVTTIKKTALQNNLDTDTEHTKQEKKTLLKETKAQYLDEREKLIKQAKNYEKQVESVNKEAKKIEQDNLELEEIAKIERKKSKLFADLTSSVMGKRHGAIVNTKKAMSNTHRAHEDAYSKICETDKVVSDFQIFQQSHYPLLYDLRNEAKHWKTKTYEEDRKVTMTKSQHLNLEDRYCFLKRIGVTLRSDLAQEQLELEKQKMIADEYIESLNQAEAKKETVRNSQIELQNFTQETKNNLEVLICETKSITKTTVEDSKSLKIENSEKSIEKKDLQKVCDSLLRHRQEHLNKTSQAQAKTNRTSKKVGAAHKQLVAERAVRMRLKEKLLIVTERRQDLKAAYASVFNNYYTQTRNQTVLKINVAKEVDAIKEEHEKIKLNFGVIQRKITIETHHNRVTKRNLKRMESQLFVAVDTNRQTAVKTKKTIEKTKVSFGEAKIGKKKEIEQLDEKIKTIKSENETLKKTKLTKVQSNVSVLKHNQVKVENKVKNLKKNFETRWMTINKLRQTVTTMSERKAERDSIYEDYMFQLESIRKKIRMQLRRHASEKRRSARIVYFLSYKLSTVNNASLVIVRGLQALGRDLKDLYRKSNTEIRYMRQSQLEIAYSKIQFQKERAFMMSITNFAYTWNQSDLKIMRETNEFVAKRSSTLKVATSHMDGVLYGLDDITSNICLLRSISTKTFSEQEKKRQRRKESRLAKISKHRSLPF